MIRRFRRLFAGAVEPAPSLTPVLIDAETLFRPPGATSSSGPREKLRILGRLGTLVEQEGIPLTVVFRGTPLREAGDGATYRGMTVRYAPEGPSSAEMIGKILRKRRGGENPVVVTAERAVEAVAAPAGCPVMRSATFRKWIEAGDGSRPRRPHKPRHERERPRENENDRIVRELIDPL